MLNDKIMKEITGFSRYDKNFNVGGFISKYTIKDKTILSYLQMTAEHNNGRLPEWCINKFGLTPRHIQITFNGAYIVDLVPQDD